MSILNVLSCTSPPVIDLIDLCISAERPHPPSSSIASKETSQAAKNFQRLIHLGCTGRDVLSTGARSLLPHQSGKTTLTLTHKASSQDLFQKTGSAMVFCSHCYHLVASSHLQSHHWKCPLKPASTDVHPGQDSSSTNADVTTQLLSMCACFIAVPSNTGP